MPPPFGSGATCFTSREIYQPLRGPNRLHRYIWTKWVVGSGLRVVGDGRIGWQVLGRSGATAYRSQITGHRSPPVASTPQSPVGARGGRPAPPRAPRSTGEMGQVRPIGESSERPPNGPGLCAWLVSLDRDKFDLRRKAFTFFKAFVASPLSGSHDSAALVTPV